MKTVLRLGFTTIAQKNKGLTINNIKPNLDDNTVKQAMLSMCTANVLSNSNGQISAPKYARIVSTDIETIEIP